MPRPHKRWVPWLDRALRAACGVDSCDGEPAAAPQRAIGELQKAQQRVEEARSQLAAKQAERDAAVQHRADTDTELQVPGDGRAGGTKCQRGTECSSLAACMPCVRAVAA